MREPDFATSYRTGVHRRFPQEHREVVASGLHLIHVEQTSHALADAVTDEHVLGLTLSGAASVRWSWGDRWRTIAHRTRGHFGVSPARSPGMFEVDGDHRLLLLSWPEAFTSSVFVDAGVGPDTDFGALHDHYHRDPLVFELAQNLWRCALDDSPVSAALADAAMRTLVLQLAAIGHRTQPKRERMPAVLSSSEVGQIAEWIDAHLAERITVAELAQLAGRPISTFSRQFRLATGSSPHRYVTSRRIDSARERLRNTATPIAQVAIDVGFAHQAHLTRTFTARVGVSPAAYRRSHEHATRPGATVGVTRG